MAINAADLAPRATRSSVSQGLAMRLYWVLIATLSLGLLGLTVHVATPPDAAELVEAHIGR